LSCAASANEGGCGKPTSPRKAGITVSTLVRIERGQSDPRWTNVRAIARVLDVELDELGAAVEMEEQ
jgi:DNA-binding XRE family transcriptional regulator